MSTLDYPEVPELTKQKNDDGDLPTGSIGRLRFRLSVYGSQASTSVRTLVKAIREAVINLAAAIAGSIFLLPVVILLRGTYVLFNSFFKILKPLTLSLIRFIFDAIKSIVLPLRNVMVNFNKEILYPLLKRIQEDDAAALIAFGLLVVIIAVVVIVLTVIF